MKSGNNDDCYADDYDDDYEDDDNDNNAFNTTTYDNRL